MLFGSGDRLVSGMGLKGSLILTLVAVLCALAPIVAYGIAFWGQWSLEVEAWASYATFLSGTVAVILNAFAVIALVLTLWLQQSQIVEIKENERRRELSTNLTQLLETLRTNLEATDIRKKNTGELIYQGRDAYRYYYKKLRRIYNRHLLEWAAPEFDGRALVRNSFDELYQRHGSDFGHYFRTLYHCIMLVHTAEISRDERKRFIDLVTCRLSKSELLLLMYNCLGSIGERRFKDLAEEYSLLEHVPMSALIDESHARMFTSSAFGSDARVV